MSHHVAHICAEHKIVQRQCRCPNPITTVIEEECKHAPNKTGRTIIWNGTRTVAVNLPLDTESAD